MFKIPTRLVFSLAALSITSGCTWFDPSMGMGQRVDAQTKTRSIFSLPRFGVGPLASGLPAEEQQCRKRLKRLGVNFEDVPPIRDSAACGIDHPVKVTAFSGGISLKPAATLNCAMAEETARWVEGDLAVAARTRYLVGVREIYNMSSYSCRKIRGTNTWSEHSTGNALDIGAITLDTGRRIDVAKPGFFAFREKGYLQKVRMGACDHFTTVLGPGSDAAHADHFHFDLRRRKSGYRHCD
ncbi:MAG: extensin family protein [Pseudomonadota bacterium]